LLVEKGFNVLVNEIKINTWPSHFNYSTENFRGVFLKTMWEKQDLGRVIKRTTWPELKR
jgi:hypothetical protein